ncbi:MAG: hypothetical protein K8S87_11935 [Planctomycetes bacterium]|nr:hypothetical protein [Planctomycetota bacterium]
MSLDILKREFSLVKIFSSLFKLVGIDIHATFFGFIAFILSVIAIILVLTSNGFNSPEFKVFKDPKKTENVKMLSTDEFNKCFRNLILLTSEDFCSTCSNNEQKLFNYKQIIFLGENVFERKCLTCGHLDYFDANTLMKAQLPVKTYTKPKYEEKPDYPTEEPKDEETKAE